MRPGCPPGQACSSRALPEAPMVWALSNWQVKSEEQHGHSMQMERLATAKVLAAATLPVGAPQTPADCMSLCDDFRRSKVAGTTRSL